MPIYEYECSVCKHQIEVLQKVSDLPLQVCEHCGAAESLTKVISKNTFQLSGGGWAKDLYGGVGGKNNK